jgi:hypothetical protein
MKEQNRIPEKRPIIYELFCPKCGGSLYALDEAEFYIGRSERNQNLAGFTITKLECVLCREQFTIDGIGLKYEKSIADELGWPFHVPIPDGPSAVPKHVETRMRKREREPDPQGDLIDDFYADNLSRSPLPLEKDVLRYVLKRKGRIVQSEPSLEEIQASSDEGCNNQQILGVSARRGIEHRKLPQRIFISDFSFGDIVETSYKNVDGSISRKFYVVYDDAFHSIALISQRHH